MSRNKQTQRERVNQALERTENLSKVLQMSKAMQTRFTLIPAKYLNKTTVAGIRDMSLGKIKDGKPIGGNVVRVNYPSHGTKSDFHRICIDPKGVSNKANPHIPISPGTVKAAEVIQSGLKVTGKVVFVISLVATGVRVAKSIYDEVTIDDEINALKLIVSGLEEDLSDSTLSDSQRAETDDALDYARGLLNTANDSKKHRGKKTLLTIVCISSEYGGAAALGLAGAESGAMIGAAGGPVGAIAGAVTGGVVGAIVGSEIGRSAVDNFEWDDKNISTETHGSLISWGEELQGEVLGLDGNVSVGVDGIHLGARASLFDLTEKNEGNVSFLKAGGNFDASTNGFDVGVEAKVVRYERNLESVDFGGGLNLDTGFKYDDNGVKMEFLGFGFSNDNSGLSFKLPIFDIKFKN